MNTVSSIQMNLLKLAAALALAPASLFVSADASAATYFVRTDGGDATQCNGTTDAAYPGAGTGLNCAWRHLYYALPTNGPARIAGGDTLIVGAGSYMIGWGAPGAAGGRCYDGGRWDCYLPPIPSGPSATQKTRILGKGHDTGCAVPPKLWGTERVNTVLNLRGSSNVEVSCLEITDQSDCVEHHSASGARCNRDVAPYGNWASAGIKASASQNVELRNLNIHGMAHTGIQAGGLTNWLLQGVKINANGWVGWDGDIGTGSSNSGQITMRDIEIAWNGCGERWQTGQPWACWAQQAGGYGDGLGTARTGGQWLIEDAFIHHNTSDGIDLLYMDGAASTSVTMRRVHAQGNAGNQLKMLGTGTIENSIVIGDCGYFQGRDYMVYGDHCRALGNALSLTMAAGQATTVRHNTIIGQGDCLVMSEGGDAASRLNMQNNVLIGQADYTSSGDQTCGHYAYNSPGAVNYAGNLFWNVKASQCPAGSICQDPKLTNMNMSGFDATPLAGSPVVDKVAPLIATDFLLQPRPSGANGDIGAIELQSGNTPPPVCTRAAPTLGLTGPSGTVTPGSQVNFTLSVRNNDSSACTTTTFNLARSIPAGWTGTLAANTATVAPGAQSSVSLSVTSTSSTADGDYGIGAGASSSVGPIHTANVAATLRIAAPAQVCTRSAPTLSLTGPTASVAPGIQVTYTLNLRNNDSSACGNTSFNLARSIPTGWTGTLSATTSTLAPGAQTTATLAVTSPAATTTGSYGIGVGAGSAAGSVHTVNAATSMSVVVPDTGDNVLSGGVVTNKVDYARGEVVYMAALVKRNGVPLRGASVKLTLVRPNGTTWVRTLTTGSDGFVRSQYRAGTKASDVGGYYLYAVTNYGGATLNERNRFNVY